MLVSYCSDICEEPMSGALHETVVIALCTLHFLKKLGLWKGQLN